MAMRSDLNADEPMSHHRGTLIGGDEGRSLVASANKVMSEEGILNPTRFTAMYAPTAREP